MWFGIELSWGIHFDFYQSACQSLAVLHSRHNCFVLCPRMMVPASLLPCWSAFTSVTTFRTQVCQGRKCFGAWFYSTNLHVSHNLLLDRVCFHLSATQICDNGAVVTWKKSQPYGRLRSVTGAAVPQNTGKQNLPLNKREEAPCRRGAQRAEWSAMCQQRQHERECAESPVVSV